MCTRKTEILPSDASDVTRRDKSVVVDGVKADERSYTFTLPNKALFYCEATRFENHESAEGVAVKKIPERPQEQARNPDAWFALSDRSLWLLKNKTLTWCMYTDSADKKAESMRVMKTVFLKDSGINKE